MKPLLVEAKDGETNTLL